MRKNIIYTQVTGNANKKLNFRYRDETGRDILLFTRNYDKKVHRYFEDGRSIAQLHRDTSWHGCRYLSKIVEDRIPTAIRAVEKGGAYAAGTFKCIYRAVD